MSTWAAAALVSVAAAAGPPVEPVHVEFRCLDGREVAGEVSAWDDGGLTGSFGRIAWTDLSAPRAWHVLMQLIDVDSAAEWSAVADVMSAAADGLARAERARTWARWLGGLAARPVDGAAPPEPPQVPVAPGAADAGTGAGGHAPGPRPEAAPDAGVPQAQPWPALNDEEQAQAVRQLKEESERTFRAVGLPYELFEGPSFLLYTDLPADQAARWLSRLYAVYGTLLASFDLPPRHNVFWGKAVVVVGSRRDQFVALERAVFGRRVSPHLHGLCHLIGPKAIISFWKLPDDETFGAAMAHELTHAFMHRYRSDAPLPLWADEGFADYVAQRVVPGSPIDANRRERGLWFVRSHGPVDNVLEIESLSDAWPGPHFVCQPVSYLMVRMMFERDPKRAIAWIDAIKDGKDWERALDEDYGLTRRRLIELFIQECLEDSAGAPETGGG